MGFTEDQFQKDVVKELRGIRRNCENLAKAAIRQADHFKVGLSSLSTELKEPAKAPTISYLSGPISSDMDGYQEKFNKAENIAKQKGRVVLKPSVLPIGLSEQSYMRIGLAMVEAADEIVMLDGWEQSAGARIEREYAERIGKRITTLAELKGDHHEQDPSHQ